MLRTADKRVAVMHPQLEITDMNRDAIGAIADSIGAISVAC
jgi:hypothetical protein